MTASRTHAQDAPFEVGDLVRTDHYGDGRIQQLGVIIHRRADDHFKPTVTYDILWANGTIDRWINPEWIERTQAVGETNSTADEKTQPQQ